MARQLPEGTNKVIKQHTRILNAITQLALFNYNNRLTHYSTNFTAMIAITDEGESVPCVFGTRKERDIIVGFLRNIPRIGYEAITGTNRLELDIPVTYTLEKFYTDVRQDLPNGQNLINRTVPLAAFRAILLPDGLPDMSCNTRNYVYYYGILRNYVMINLEIDDTIDTISGLNREYTLIWIRTTLPTRECIYALLGIG